MIRGRGLPGTVATALAFTVTAVAQEYSFRFYGPNEGLENRSVVSLAQDHAGYIWAGTEGGLYRYDGTRFHLMGEAEGLPCSTEVHTIFVAADGAIWVNTCARTFRFDGERFRVVRGVEGLRNGTQVMADGTARASVLISTLKGVYEASQSADGEFSTHRYPLPMALEDKPMHGILRQGTRLWFGCDRQLCMQEAGQTLVFGRDQGLPEDLWEGIQVSPDGTVWARSPKSLYRREPGQTMFSQAKADIASSGFWGALTLCRDGSIMVPTDQGLAIHSKEGWSIVNRQRGLRNENTGAVLEDRERSIWIGLVGGGLARWLGKGIWEFWKMDDGLPSDIVWNIRRGRNGFLWVGTSLGLARIDGSGRIRTWTKHDGLGGDNVRWLAETSDGSIWAAMKPGGLARIEPVSGKIRLAGPKDGLPCDPEDVFVDRHDRLWLPTHCGLFLNERPSVSNRVIRVETPEAFGPIAWKAMEDAQGTIWVVNPTGLWSLRNEQWRQHRRAEGLLTDNPYMMAMAGDGSIWMRHRYDAGIDRLEVSGDRIVHATAIVPADPKTAAITPFHGFDAFGNFWRGSAEGVAVLHDRVWTKFTTADGLVFNDCDGEAFWADRDGGVWLGTSGGLAHYRAGNSIPPAPVADPTIVRLEINQSTRLIRVAFSSLNYKAEQLVQFAYRFDQAPWTESVERNVSISGLGPGKHRLEVRSRVRYGRFSPAIAAADFQLQPRWRETWWVRLLAVACGMLAIIQFVRWRLSAAAQKQAELEALVAARTTNLIKVNRSLDDKARALRESENRLKNAERLAHVGHWDWNVKANQLSWSEEMFRIFDVPQDRTISYGRFLQAVIPQDRERLERWVDECLAKKNGRSIEFQIARPNGDTRIVSCTSEVSLDEGGLPARLFGACQDITDSRRAQQEDFARKKLESLGTLAGGIAHDFNNLLGGVLAQAELGLDESATGSYANEELTAIRNAAMRGSEIVRQLMKYAGQENEVLGPVDVSQIVAEMLELLKVSISKRATLVTDLGWDLRPVRASAAQIRQIVMNLVTNAAEAIGDRGGVIRVSTSGPTSDQAATIAKDLSESYYLQMEVSDTGCGMSQEIQAKVFDPFFSTKGAGHGLGLAVVRGIVRGLGGAVQISSEVGQGTIFRILLPCVETAAAAPGDRVADADEPAHSSQQFSVLVVEDEDPLRHAVVRMLRKTGFSVLEAADGTAALDLLRANASTIDLILLDMTIPGASSQELVAEAAQTRPNARVVLTSAYSPEMMRSPASASQIRGFIRKPYQIGDLVQTLRRASFS